MNDKTAIAEKQIEYRNYYWTTSILTQIKSKQKIRDTGHNQCISPKAKANMMTKIIVKNITITFNLVTKRASFVLIENDVVGAKFRLHMLFRMNLFSEGCGCDREQHGPGESFTS